MTLPPSRGPSPIQEDIARSAAAESTTSPGDARRRYGAETRSNQTAETSPSNEGLETTASIGDSSSSSTTMPTASPPRTATAAVPRRITIQPVINIPDDAPTPPLRALPSANTSTATSRRLKRSRSPHPTSSIAPPPSRPPPSKRTRDLLFDAYASVAFPSSSTSSSPSSLFAPGFCCRPISSADDLERAELLRLFEILHACGRAAQPGNTRASTRGSIEGFLDAAFNGWAADGGGSSGEGGTEVPARPVYDIVVEGEVVAGVICGMYPSFFPPYFASLLKPICL